MPQHDYDVENNTSALVRADINAVLSAIVTHNSGPASPTPTFARQRWADTAARVVRRRNAANSAWITESTDEDVRVVARAVNVEWLESDIGRTVRATGTYTQTLQPAATLGEGWWVYLTVAAGATVTLDPAGAELIAGAATLAIAGPAQGQIICDGTQFWPIGFWPGGVGTPAAGRTALGATATGGAVFTAADAAAARAALGATATGGAVFTAADAAAARAAIGVVAATDAVSGIAELATGAEAAAGTDAARIVTPAALRAGLNATGSAPVFACRAWVNFDGTGTVAIRASGNVSSITDNGVGDYTVNFTTAMPDANYAVVGTAADQVHAEVVVRIPAVPQTTAAVRVATIRPGVAAGDSSQVNVTIFR